MECTLRTFGHVLPDVKYPCIDIRDSHTIWIWLSETTWIDMDREFFEEVCDALWTADQQ